MYVLPESSKRDENCWLTSCLEVLQKPNYSTMKMRKALVKLGKKLSSQIFQMMVRRSLDPYFTKGMERKECTRTACFGAGRS